MTVTQTVSVALCTFNGEEYIADQLRSIASQTIVPDEIVISDDASTDNTVSLITETIKKLKKDFPDFSQTHLVVTKNKTSLGVTKNFEQAISQTSGELIVLSDQDDVWEKNKIERILSSFSGHKDFIFGDATLIDDSGNSLGHSLFEALAVTSGEKKIITSSHPTKALIKRNIVTGATAGFKREIFELASPFPPGWVHDEWLAMVASLTGKSFAITESLTRYRQHGNNQIGAKKKTASTRVDRLVMNGLRRNQRLLIRAQELVYRLDSWDVSEENVRLCQSALRFQLARNNFDQNRFVRFPQVMFLVLSGRYFTVSNGLRDVLRDIVQPLTPDA